MELLIDMWVFAKSVPWLKILLGIVILAFTTAGFIVWVDDISSQR